MAKKEIRFKVAPKVEEYLRDLAATGLYGRNANEVAATLILDGLKHVISTGLLQIRRL